MRLPKGFEANSAEIAVSFDPESRKFCALGPVSPKSRNVFGPGKQVFKLSLILESCSFNMFLRPEKTKYLQRFMS